jgi:very-short-patch-repair endonuclease
MTQRGSTKELEGVVPHRVRKMPRTFKRRGLITTTVERALLDIALTEPFADLQRALNEADYRRLVSESSMRSVLDESRGHRGAAALKEAIADKAPTRSPLEDRFYALLRAAKLPLPMANQMVDGMECDFVWPELRLVVETDGWAAHGTARRKRRDRRKEKRLEALGWHVERVPRAELEHHAYALIARLSPLLLTRQARLDRSQPMT